MGAESIQGAEPSRRTLIKQGAAAAGIVWATPIVLAKPVAAATGSEVGGYTYCFDDGTSEGWTMNGLWNISSDRSVSPNFSLHYGTGSGGTYNTGAANSGTATSPLFTVPTTGDQDLTFDIWREIENYGSGSWDEFSISVAPGGTVLYSRAIDGGTGGLWVSETIDLSAFAGQSIQLIFSFDTGDAQFNDFEGIYVDNIRVPGGTAPGGQLASLSRTGTGVDWAQRALDDRPKPTKRELQRREREARARRFAEGPEGTDGVSSGIKSGG